MLAQGAAIAAAAFTVTPLAAFADDEAVAATIDATDASSEAAAAALAAPVAPKLDAEVS